MPETAFFHVTGEGELRSCASWVEAEAAARDGGYVWVDLQDPSREQLAALAGPLGLHPLSVEDCLDEAGLPKIDDYPGHSFLLVNSFSICEREVFINEVDFFIGARFLVSVSGHVGPGLRFADRLTGAIALGAQNVGRGPDFLLHVLLDSVVDAKCQAIETVQTELDAAEEDIVRDLSGFELGRLTRLRRRLLLLRKSLFHEREVLVRICRRDCPFIGEKSIYDYRDVYDHLTKFFEEVEICREIILGIMEMYLSLVNNRMAAVANRTNVSVRRLTFITTIFMPLSFLAGVGGMSEYSMMTGPGNWRVSYTVFLAAMAAVGAATYVLLRWIEARPSSGAEPEVPSAR